MSLDYGSGNGNESPSPKSCIASPTSPTYTTNDILNKIISNAQATCGAPGSVRKTWSKDAIDIYAKPQIFTNDYIAIANRLWQLQLEMRQLETSFPANHIYTSHLSKYCIFPDVKLPIFTKLLPESIRLLSQLIATRYGSTSYNDHYQLSSAIANELNEEENKREQDDEGNKKNPDNTKSVEEDTCSSNEKYFPKINTDWLSFKQTARIRFNELIKEPIKPNFSAINGGRKCMFFGVHSSVLRG